MPVEGNHYSYSKIYKNGNLSLAQSLVSSGPCEPSDFYSSVCQRTKCESTSVVSGKQNGTKTDTLVPDW